MSKTPRFHPEDVKALSSRHLLKIEKLEFILDSKVKDIINKEQKNYNAWIEQLLVDHVIYEGFGKNECKKIGISPDAVMQLAFQLALYEQEGQMVPTYESCSTAAFKRGRTETIRSCTLQTKAACVALTEKKSDISTAELKKLIFDCSNIHGILIKEAAMGKFNYFLTFKCFLLYKNHLLIYYYYTITGQAFDRHLFALKWTCEELGIRKPAIFEDPSYDTLNHNVLSTSTLASPAILSGGFGPVVNNGYGIG